MLHAVHVGTQPISSYQDSAGPEALDELRRLARPLHDARVLQLNATPYGGVCAEILRSEVPLLRELGLRADWKLITGDEAVVSLTRTIHKGLPGAPPDLTPAQREKYLSHS